jgi:hypothetical protein
MWTIFIWHPWTPALMNRIAVTDRFIVGTLIPSCRMMARWLVIILVNLRRKITFHWWVHYHHML